MAPTRWRAFAGGSAERLCEAACRRGSIDQPVSIRALKRFVTDQFGGRATPLASFPADECDGLEEAVHLARCLASRDYRRPAPGERVAIIGSGPAGLAAAHDLALVCFSPVVFEMESKPAGMLYTGIPAYRLPREPIDAEVELIRPLGVARSDGLARHVVDLHAPARNAVGRLEHHRDQWPTHRLQPQRDCSGTSAIA